MHFILTLTAVDREKREYTVYRKLIETVPGLEDRLVSSPDDLPIIAEQVSHKFIMSNIRELTYYYSYVKVHQELEATTPKA